MTRYYGIGSYYTKDKEDYANDFYENNMVCISSRSPERLYFNGMFNQIKRNDIAFLKSLKRKGRILKIKAVGLVTNDETKKNNFGYKKEVDWLTPLNHEGLLKIPLKKDGGNHRTNRIFQEFNPDIIDQIDDLIKKYKR